MAADSQYVIDIAAQLPDGEATISELDRLSEELTGAGKRSDSFQSAIKQLSTELDAAKAATAGANAELKDGSDAYRVLERDAVRASKAFERAGARQLAADTALERYKNTLRGVSDAHAALGTAESAAELARATAEYKNLEAGAKRAAKAVALVGERNEQAKSALADYTVTLRNLEDASAKATAKQNAVAGSLRKVEKLASHADDRNQRLSEKLDRVGAAAGVLPGPFGRVVQTFTGAGKAAHELNVAVGASRLAMLAAVAVVAIVVIAIVALTAAVVAGTVAFYKYATSMADSAREAQLTRDALAQLNPETRAAVGAFDDVTEATGLADAELAKLADKLRAAKVNARDMPAALRAAATAEAALGSGGADAFIQRIAEGKSNAADFADEIDRKFGGIVAERMRGLSAQSARFSRLWGKLFAGLNLDPTLNALDTIVGMFDRGHPLAQAFGAAVEGVFDFMSEHVEKAAYAVEAFALGFAIQMTKMYIAAKPVLAWVADLFGFEDKDNSLLDLVGGLGKAFAGVVVVGGAVVGLIAGVVLALIALPAAVGAASLAIGYGLRQAFEQAFEWFAELYETVKAKALEIGSALMRGLVEGITGGVKWVTDAVTGTVGGVIDTAKGLLGIQSPSKVFAEIGDDTAEGFAKGVDRTAPVARQSLSDLVSPDTDGTTSSGGGNAQTPSAVGNTNVKSSFAGAVLNFYGVDEEKFRDILTKLIDDDAEALAGAEVA